MPLAVHQQEQTQHVLVNPEAFATTMLISLVDTYGTELFSWSPEMIRSETERDFNITWPMLNFDRLMAGVVLVTTDKFYKSLPSFIELCTVLSGAGATPDVFVPADTAECAWGITEALLIWPPDESDPFNEEIRAYVGKVIEMEGIITPPDILRLGILSGDHKTKIHTNYSSDPDLYSAIWGAEHSKTEEINNLIKARLTALIQQLSVLQLTNGDTTEIAKKMLSKLDTTPEQGSPL